MILMLSSILMVLVFVVLVGCLFFTRKKGSSPTSLIGRRLPTSPTKKHSKPKNWRPYPAIVSKYKLLAIVPRADVGAKGRIFAAFIPRADIYRTVFPFENNECARFRQKLCHILPQLVKRRL